MAAKPDERADVLIAGGGLVGATAALALAQAGLETVVVDAVDPGTATAPAFDGRVSAIAFASCRMLEALDLWPALADQAQPINDILVSDGRLGSASVRGGAGPGFLHFDHREIGTEPLGHLIENRHLRLALFAGLADEPRVRLLAPERVERLEPRGTGTTAHLAGGGRVSARLALAADGRASPLREAAGIRTMGWSYGQTGIVSTVAHERPHEGVAHEYFLPGGPFAILPMTGNRASLVWTERDRDAQALLALEEQAFADELTKRFGPHLGAVAPAGLRWSYPLSLHLALRYTAPRLALLGDAAHGIHPIAGQGLNLGLRDVAALAETLADAARLGLDIGAETVLEGYARWRRFDNVSLAAATDVLNRLFSNDVAPLRAARGLGLAAVNRIPPLRRLFMRHAGGVVALGGEAKLPRLLRGEPV